MKSVELPKYVPVSMIAAGTTALEQVTEQILTRLLPVEWATPWILVMTTKEVFDHAQSRWAEKLLKLRIHCSPVL